MRQGSWSLVALLVVCALLVGLAVLLAPRYLARTTATGTVGVRERGDPLAPGAAGLRAPGGVAAPIERGHDVECMNNLRQLRGAIDMHRTSNESAPASLSDLTREGVSGSMLLCPVSRQPYGYRPGTGQVGCPYPAHQRY